MTDSDPLDKLLVEVHEECVCCDYLIIDKNPEEEHLSQRIQHIGEPGDSEPADWSTDEPERIHKGLSRETLRPYIEKLKCAFGYHDYEIEINRHTLVVKSCSREDCHSAKVFGK